LNCGHSKFNKLVFSLLLFAALEFLSMKLEVRRAEIISKVVIISLDFAILYPLESPD